MADAPDPELSRLEQEIKRAQREADLAELLKKKAQAEKDVLTAQLPQSSVTALEGKVAIDDKLTIEVEILAHAAMCRIAGQIARDIATKATAGETVVIYSERDLGLLSRLRAAGFEIDNLVARYKALLRDEVSLVLPELFLPVAAGAVLKSVIDVLALFRTDTEIKGKSLTFDEAALVAEITRQLPGNPPPRIIYPALHLPGRLAPDGGSDLLKRLRELSSLRSEAEQKIRDYESKSDDDKKKDPFGPKVAPLKALHTEYDKLAATLMATDEKTGHSGLTLLLKAEVLSTEVSNGRILFLKALAGGGMNMTTRNLFTGSKVYHSGGAIIAYILFDNKGAITLSRTLYSYQGRVQPSQISNNFPSDNEAHP